MSEAQPTVAGPTTQDILELTHKMQMNLNALQAQLVTVRSYLAAQPNQVKLTSELTCLCGLTFKTERRLATHIQNVHNGPPVPLTEHELHA